MVSMSPTHKKIYRIILVSILIVLLIPFSFVVILASAAIHKSIAISPYDFPGSVWESQEPYIHLEVSEKAGDGISGIIQVGEEKKEIEVIIQWSSVDIVDKEMMSQMEMHNNVFYDDCILLKAICKYSEKNIVMKIDEDNLYGGKYKKIVLDRVD